MAKRKCLIDIELANAVNHFLYGVRAHGKSLHASLHGSLFFCPYCRKPVSPVKSQQPHFRHRKGEICAGPPSSLSPEKTAKRATQPKGAVGEK